MMRSLWGNRESEENKTPLTSIQSHINDQSQSKLKKTALQKAISSKNYPAFQSTLNMPNINLEAVDANGQTALHHTCQIDDPRFLKALLDKKANVKAKDAKGNTALHIALEQKPISLELITTLLGAGLQIEDFNNNYENALHVASRNPELTEEIWTFLLEKASTQALNPVSSLKTTPLITLIRRSPCNIKMIESLINHLASSNQPADKDYPLNLAISKKLTDVARVLLENHANPNQKDGHGKTPIEYAAESNNVDMIIKLMEKGVQMSSPEARNALTIALNKANYEAVFKLVELGVNPKGIRAAPQGKSGYMSAKFASYSSYEVKKSDKVQPGDNILHFAMREGHLALAQLCLRNSADLVYEVNDKAHSPAFIAVQRLNKTMAQCLKDYFDPNQNKGESLWLKAVSRGFTSEQELEDFFKNQDFELNETQQAMYEQVQQKYRVTEVDFFGGSTLAPEKPTPTNQEQPTFN